MSWQYSLAVVFGIVCVIGIVLLIVELKKDDHYSQMWRLGLAGGVFIVGLALSMAFLILGDARDKDQYRNSCQAAHGEAIFARDHWFCVKQGSVLHV